jgi:hypothetical protein
MKIKHLIIVSLLLAVLTIGAVSASEDIVSDDTLAVDDEGVDLAETPEDDVLADDEGSEEVLGDEYDDVQMNVPGIVDTDLTADDYVASIDDYELGGEVSLSIDNTQYFKKTVTTSDIDYESDLFYIYFKDLNLPNTFSGKHNVVLTYLKNGAATSKSEQQTVEFKYFPNVNSAGDYAVGEQAVIGIKSLPGYSGTATIYNYDPHTDTKGSALQTIAISDGSGNFVLTGLAKGDHSFTIESTINGQKFENSLSLSIYDNTPGFSSSISANVVTVGNSVVVSLNGPKLNENAYVYVDGKEIKRIPFTSGSISEVIPSSLLPVGKHYVTVQTMVYGEYEIKSFYSNTFEVTVNAPAPAQAPAKKVDTIKLTLNKVTVKKSAKKLVLKATLKINGKKVKGKKLTFKFNGKTYKAKTNKKGVAKVTIKKNVLKKLKVGKKVKYQVSYGGKTVKKTVKVKK